MTRLLKDWFRGSGQATAPPRRVKPVLHHDKPGPRIEVNAWDTSNVVRAVAEIVGTHPYPYNELMLMATTYFYHRPELVIDIGTHQGKSARIWHELGAYVDTPASVHTIDLFDQSHPEFPGKDVGRYIRGLPVEQHVGDGAEMASRLLDEHAGKVTLLFLDGDHSFDTVVKELELVTRIDDGAVLLHDTFYQPGSGYNHGPYEAVNDFLKRHAVEQVIHQNLGLPGMTYLKLA